MVSMVRTSAAAPRDTQLGPLTVTWSPPQVNSEDDSVGQAPKIQEAGKSGLRSLFSQKQPTAPSP